ncbi:carboxypeptidase-like regulatory domain-containing protein [Hymenobacter pini]|uniref:carboxypeptidase-like regulatory domain-containing protein n=1 Tax=Hymenobacter pini TaxID=2880879 RepID=UPI001CF5608B|nr:carboxypeptidase-like regulatory domain-containing protein [Hymenobacter pini]MCA8832036.1 carboxypeptidase-like regulatory domain-containing protein [Hymenobacter pini]
MASTAHAQVPELGTLYTGRVLNQAAVPLAGASVLVKGTAIAATTNANGAFRFMGPSGPQVLVVSFHQHLTVQRPVTFPDTTVVLTLFSTQPRVTAPPRRKRL